MSVAIAIYRIYSPVYRLQYENLSKWMNLFELVLIGAITSQGARQ
jgi:hypothetical protein